MKWRAYSGCGALAQALHSQAWLHGRIARFASAGQNIVMHARPDILCIGSVLWDIIGRSPTQVAPGADIPGRISRTPGGVAMNIAAAMARLGLHPAILTAIGRDAEGDALMTEIARMGIDCNHVHRPDDLPTDRYMAVEGRNGLIAAIADAHSLEAAGETILLPLSDGRLGSADAPWDGPVALDGNLTGALLATIAASPLFGKASLGLVPASPGKAERLLPLIGHPRLTLYVNLEEAGVLCGTRFPAAADAALGLMQRGAHRVLVTNGAADAADGGSDGIMTATPPEVPVTRVTGAGDTFMAAHMVAELRGAGREAALAAALKAAATFVSGDGRQGADGPAP